MEIILTKHLGFCYGVKRAIQIATENSTLEKDSRAVYTLGPLIHNPQMIKRLEAKGVLATENLEDVESGATLIIRSHGVGPKVYDKIKKMGLNLIDATCPHVKKAQMSAKRLVDDGYKVVVIGERKHPEVLSILEWTDDNAVVVEHELEVQKLMPCDKLGIVCQTTLSNEKFLEIASKLLTKARDVRILRTICTATDERQQAALDLVKRVEVMLVVGGKNSANTTRLAQICSEYSRTYHIETAAELCDEWFEGIKKVGITAGASTPDWIIKEVYDKCLKK